MDVLPKVHSKARLYKKIYGDLIGTKYEGKCPDLKIDGKFYEHEGYTSNDSKKAFKNMLNRGLQQSARIIIEEVQLTDRYMMRGIKNRIYSGNKIEEVWIRNNKDLRLLYKTRGMNNHSSCWRRS